MTSSKRSLLAGLWSLVGLLTTLGFFLAIFFAIASQKYDPNYNNNGNYYNNDEDERHHNNNNGAITVTSRAMVFAAIWTAVLSGILVIYGTVILGVTIPFTGRYYACCTGNVHRMTPLTLGSFGGSLLMFANLTLVCSILFGEFEVRRTQRETGAKQRKRERDLGVFDASLLLFSRHSPIFVHDTRISSHHLYFANYLSSTIENIRLYHHSEIQIKTKKTTTITAAW